jgi:hypothetical protein
MTGWRTLHPDLIVDFAIGEKARVGLPLTINDFSLQLRQRLIHLPKIFRSVPTHQIYRRGHEREL